VAGADHVPAVRLLGSLEVDGPAGLVVLGGRKPRAILTLLLMDAGRVVSTDRLIDAVWGDEPPDSGEATLQTYVSRLRRALDGVVTIVTRGPGYAAEVDARQLDVALAEAAIGEARVLAAAGDDRTAAQVLEGAIALWRGRPLDEFADEDWARPEANRLSELRMAAWEDLADARLATGGHRHLVGPLEALVGEAPLREGLIARLVVALARSGRQVDALTVLRRHRDHLREELGLDPGPALERLEGNLLAHEPDVVAPPDTAQPRQVPASLAVADDELAGRVGERTALVDVLEQLAGGRGAVVVVSGDPGIGKTALVMWAASAAARVGARVVSVAGTGDEQAPALWPWLPAVRDLLTVVGPDALAAPDADLVRAIGSQAAAHDPYAVRLALAALVNRAAAQQSLLVVVEDLQGLDPASQGVVQFIARETTQVPFALVVTVRSPGDDPARPLSACLEELARQPTARWLQLDGLGVDAVAVVAARAAARPIGPAVSAALVERTGGNPFLVRELTR
jgi:DNA-binding SARP family transcriptional activator